MRVAPETAELEAFAKQIRRAGAVLLDADAFDRWGPKHVHYSSELYEQIFGFRS